MSWAALHLHLTCFQYLCKLKLISVGQAVRSEQLSQLREASPSYTGVSMLFFRRHSLNYSFLRYTNKTHTHTHTPGVNALSVWAAWVGLNSPLQQCFLKDCTAAETEGEVLHKPITAQLFLTFSKTMSVIWLKCLPDWIVISRQSTVDEASFSLLSQQTSLFITHRFVSPLHLLSRWKRRSH